ncbi:hypothetical protein ACIQXW_08580 [Lysinibacillus sp. NPDC097162]|uniref:hypothetical protein n=1 Tax=Lysinibacillus sp. NPDC097162 TaxID=3364140 RepID=UPI003830DFF9
MKRIFPLIILLLLVLSVYHFKDKLIVSGDVSQQYIEQFFNNEEIYDTAHKKYGVYSMGVDQNDKLLLVSMSVSNKEYKQDVEKYFEQQLNIHRLIDYNIEVYLYENGYK